MKISGIYKIQSKLKPERIYIGSAVYIGRRWNEHLRQLKKGGHHSILLQRHFNKYGEADLQFSILLGCEKEDILKVEQYFIDSYNPYFNTCKIAGNTMGFHHTLVTIQKMMKPKSSITIQKMRKPKSKNTCENMSKSKTGKKRKPFTQEHCNNMSEGMKGRVPWNKGKKLKVS